MKPSSGILETGIGIDIVMPDMLGIDKSPFQLKGNQDLVREIGEWQYLDFFEVAMLEQRLPRVVLYGSKVPWCTRI